MKTLLTLLTLSLTVTKLFAATSGSINLSGVVPVTSRIAVTSNSTAANLNIVSGMSSTAIASSVESSNNLAGYKITMYSSNAGQLRNTSDASKKTTYQISYGGGSFAQPPASTSPVVVKNVSSLSALTSATSAVNIQVDAYAAAPAGTYTDVVTLSIVSN